MQTVATKLATQAELKNAIRAVEKRTNDRFEDRFERIVRITKEHNRNLNALEKRIYVRLANVHAALSTQMSDFESALIEHVNLAVPKIVNRVIYEVVPDIIVKSNQELEQRLESKFDKKIDGAIEAILAGIDARLNGKVSQKKKGRS